MFACFTGFVKSMLSNITYYSILIEPFWIFSFILGTFERWILRFIYILNILNKSEKLMIQN
jgi:hypothetical protein